MSTRLLQANPTSTKEKFCYPMRVERGYVHNGENGYPILKTAEIDGDLFVYFVAELNGKTRIYVGICHRTVVIKQLTEVVRAKLAKEQDPDEYGAVCIGRPTRARSRSKIRPKQTIADKTILAETYEQEKYALIKKLADNIILIPRKKDRDIVAERLIREHNAEISRREAIEAEKEKNRQGLPDTEQTVTNNVHGLPAMAAIA